MADPVMNQLTAQSAQLQTQQSQLQVSIDAANAELADPAAMLATRKANLQKRIDDLTAQLAAATAAMKDDAANVAKRTAVLQQKVAQQTKQLANVGKTLDSVNGHIKLAGGAVPAPAPLQASPGKGVKANA